MDLSIESKRFGVAVRIYTLPKQILQVLLSAKGDEVMRCNAAG